MDPDHYAVREHNACIMCAVDSLINLKLVLNYLRPNIKQFTELKSQNISTKYCDPHVH